jgi:tetrahydromethanopterin S-methyltransferase subunit G
LKAKSTSSTSFLEQVFSDHIKEDKIEFAALHKKLDDQTRTLEKKTDEQTQSLQKSVRKYGLAGGFIAGLVVAGMHLFSGCTAPQPLTTDGGESHD